MIIYDELYYRCHNALTFLSTCLQPNNRFVMSYLNGQPKIKISNIYHHLSAICALYDGAKFYNEYHFQSVANRAFEFAEQQTFQSSDGLIILENDVSETNNNAIMSLTCYKANKIYDGIKYINSILKCIKEKHVAFIYDQDTEKYVADYGLLIIVLMTYYDVTKNEEYLSTAKKISFPRLTFVILSCILIFIINRRGKNVKKKRIFVWRYIFYIYSNIPFSGAGSCGQWHAHAWVQRKRFSHGRRNHGISL